MYNKILEVPPPGDGALALRYARAAKVLGVSERTIRRMVNRGDLRGVRIGRAVSIDLNSLRRFVARGGAR